MGKSIAKNLFYNLIFQVVTLVLPLITVPYISRVLGPNGIGIYSFTLSITQYFIIIGTLGLSMYGNRQIAYTRDNQEKMSKTFWSILALRIITTGICTIFYFFIFFNSSTYQEIYMIQMINIIAAMVDISWLYTGIEDFKKTVTRNLFVKLIGVSLIFVFVKNEEDIKLYVLINVIMVLFGNAVLWTYLPRTVNSVNLRLNDIVIHIIPSIRLFIPQIAIQIYVVLDKTMIGALANVEQVGYYDQSEKIVKTVLGLVTALGTVMLPRMSNIFANGDKDKMDNYLNISLKGVAYVSVPMTMGIAGVSNEFVVWFFGRGFEPAIDLMIIFSPILFLISMSNVMGMQYLTPANRTNEFTTSVIIGAIVNVVLNLCLIPLLQAVGACIATLIAEFAVTLIQYVYLRKEIDLKQYLECLSKYVLSGAVMLIVVRIVGNSMGPCSSTTIVQALLGGVTYITILSILREKINERLLHSLLVRLKEKIT